MNEKCNFKTYKINYLQNKNRIQISSNSIFNITFVEKNTNSIQLKDILGYSKNEYSNNKSYISELDPNIDIYSDIYLREKDNSFNKYFTNLYYNNEKFSYFCSSFNSKIDNIYLLNDTTELTFELFYRSKDKIYKLYQNIDINLLLEIGN